MPEKNIMTIHVGPTGRKVFTDNLEMNQNSSNNVLELFCEGKYEFVQVFYTFPDGKTTYKHHMIPDGYDKDKASYKFHDNIDKAVTSFVIPNVTANLKVSFIGYYKNDLNQYTPVGINDFLITVIRVNNNEVYDQTYNGSDVVNIWKNINNLNALLVDLNPDYKPTTLENLQAKVDENYNELNTRLDSVPTVEDVYNKEDINQMFGTVYKYGGSVENFSDLPTNLTNEQTGVVINVRNPNGMNYVWTGSEWDALGGFDETKYYKKDYIDEVIRDTQLKAENETTAVDNKVNNLETTHSSDMSVLRNDITQINAQFADYYNKSDIDSKVSEVTTSVSELSTRVDGIETSANNYTDQKVGALTQTFNNYTSTTNSRINQLESKVTSVYTLKGSCTYEELTAKTENSVGDVWNITDKDSQNYVWTGSEWDTLGSVADFSEYAKTSEVTAQIEAAENRLNGSIETTFNGLNTELQALTATVSTNKTSTETAISNLSNDTVHVNTFEAFKTSNNAAISAVDTRVTNLTSSVNTALTGKANASDVYTKNETDNAISTSINALIDGAPDTLDTLKELADAVNSNKSLVETLNEAITNKQDTLVSGTNIKTINGTSILGSGNVTISGGNSIDDNTISTSSTYSSSKIDSTYLKAPEGRLDIENGRVNLKNNPNSVYSITNNEVVMELNDDGLRYHDNATNLDVNITPYYGAIDQNVDPATIKVNGIGLARETDLNKKVSLRGDTMTGNLNAPAFTVDSTKVAAGDKPLIDGAINFKYKNTNDEASNAWLSMLPSGQLQFGSQGAGASEIGTVATQEWVNKKITNAYIYKGSVDTYDALPSNADPGFVYNVRSNGANYAWTGTEWDELGATVNLDAYALKTDLNGKQDKLVSGTNIKTINGDSILGTGNITISRATTAGTADYFKYGRGVILADSTSFTNNFNKDIFGEETDKKFHLVELRTQGNAPSCLIGQHSSGIAWKGGDTYGSLMVRWGYPQIRVSGGNGNNTNPKWTVDLIHSNNISSETIKYATTGGGMGYYDTMTHNDDGTYTITRQTGFRNISIDLIKNGAYRPTQNGHGEYGADTGIHNLPIVSGTKNFINNLLSVRDTGELYSGSTGISISENGMCWVNLGDNYTTTEQYREYFAKNNIYVQYKLATARTEKVEEKHYARYNERFILEHNRIEAEKSANVFDINTITIGNGYDYTATATDWIKAIDIPVEPNTTYTASYPIAKYAFNHGNIVSDYNKNTITTGNDTTSLSLFMYVGDYSGTVNAWFSNYMFNEGSVALPYQPYKGKVIHEKDLKNVSTNLGYYDTITENADGTYTITKQTGYINGKDFLNRSVNGVGNPYVTFEHVKVNKNIENIIGNCSRVGPDSWWNSTFTQVTITYDGNYDFLIILLPNGTAENDLSPLNDIHIQYKLPNTRTEIVEKNYCAQYNKRFILEHNKREAAKSSNLWSYENNITINAGSEKWWTLSNATMDAWGLVVGETYSIKSFVNNYTKDLAFQLLPGWSDFRDGRTFVFTSDTQIRIGGNTVASSVTFTPKIMLVKGIDIADDYQPYSGAPVHKKEFDDFKNSMKFIPYVSEATTTTSKDIETNGTYFVIPTDPSNASIKLEVKAGPQGTLQTAYFSGGIISVYRNYDRRFQVCEVKIVYGAGSSAASTYIVDSANYGSLPSGILTRITGKCKIYKLN